MAGATNLEVNDVWVAAFLHELPHDLELSVLKPLVLQHLLNGHHLASPLYCRLEHHPKRTIPDDTLSVVTDRLPSRLPTILKIF
jgi:hypothetical protein